MVRTWERYHSGQEFIGYNASCPNVNFLRESSIQKVLWGLIVEGSGFGPHIKLFSSFFSIFGAFEVYELDLSVLWVVEDVLWLYVSMANAFRMHERKSFKNQFQYFNSLELWKFSVRSAIQLFPEVLELAIFLNVVGGHFFLIHDEFLNLDNATI
jgi:hypothetical protein